MNISFKKIMPLVISGVFIFLSCSLEFPISGWKDGKIEYYLAGEFTATEISDLEKAFAAWETVCNVEFVKSRPKSTAYEIRKVYGQGWASTVGENNIKPFMTFRAENDGYRYQHILHELGHCLGFFHEHQRPDRDNYIRVYYENIMTSELEEFEKKRSPLFSEVLFAYDYNSIMHYPETAFSKNGKKTIESLDSANPVNRLGIITTIDAAKAADIYGANPDKNAVKEFLASQVINIEESTDYFEE